MAISKNYWYCDECGAIFESTRCGSCPECGSDAVDACDVCEHCGEPFKAGELHDDTICEECLEELRYDYKTMKEVSLSEMEYEEISINSLLKEMFTEKEIEEILFEHLEKVITKGMKFDGFGYINKDISEYCEAVKNMKTPPSKRLAEFRRAG